MVILTWNQRRRWSDAWLVKSTVDLIYDNKGCAMGRVVGQVGTLTDSPFVTLSKTDLGLTLLICPVGSGQSF